MFHCTSVFLIIVGLCLTAYLANNYGELSSINVCSFQARCKTNDTNVICPTRACKGEAVCCRLCGINSTSTSREVNFQWTLLLPELSTTLVFGFWAAVGVPCFLLIFLIMTRITKNMSKAALQCTRVICTLSLFAILVLLSFGMVFSIISLTFDGYFYWRCISALAIGVGWCLTTTAVLLEFLIILWPAVQRRRRMDCIHNIALNTTNQKEVTELLIAGQNQNGGAIKTCCKGPVRWINKLLLVLALIWWIVICLYIRVAASHTSSWTRSWTSGFSPPSSVGE